MFDKNYINLYETRNGETLTYGIVDPRLDQAFLDRAPQGLGSDTIKVTADITKGLRPMNITVRGVRVHGMKEDCVDEQMGRNNDVHFDEWYAEGRYCSTIKGGTWNARRSGKIVRHGSGYDVAIGEFSDQCNDPTKGTRLNHWTDDGSKVTVLLCNGDMPIFENGPEHYQVRDVRRWWWLVLLWKQVW